MLFSEYAQDKVVTRLVRMEYSAFREWVNVSAEIAPIMNQAERFFYDHAGFSYDPATETPDEGRARCARDLAAAEARMHAGPYFVDAEADDVPWDGDAPYDGPLWVVTLYSVEGTDSATVIAAMGSVACESSDPYMRVVAAELALEHLPA